MYDNSTSTEASKTDWSICVLCQENNAEVLQCPAESKRSDVGAGYRTLAENLLKFNDLNCMPIKINLARLNEGEGIENTLLNLKARWHKSCITKFNATKLKRAEKRYASEEPYSHLSSKK